MEFFLVELTQAINGRVVGTGKYLTRPEDGWSLAKAAMWGCTTTAMFFRRRDAEMAAKSTDAETRIVKMKLVPA